MLKYRNSNLKYRSRYKIKASKRANLYNMIPKMCVMFANSLVLNLDFFSMYWDALKATQR